MGEKDIEHRICELLRSGKAGAIRLANSTSNAHSLGDLLGTAEFDILQDTSAWNSEPRRMTDVIGGMTPDIVIRSRISMENRIYLEVKETLDLGYGTADSQVVRYFLHLLAMTHQRQGADIRRALLLAAPSAWFEGIGRQKWSYFLTTHAALAQALDVTLAEIRVESN
jgi:hypothetical protein